MDDTTSRSGQIPEGQGIAVVPARALTDAPLAIRLSGFSPGQRITLRASTRDEQGRPWSSEAVFGADEHGAVDVAREAPLAGSYAGADALGLLWSMVLDAQEKDVSPFATQGNAPLTVLLEASIPGLTIRASCTRDIAAPDVLRLPVREAGVAGTLFRPAAPGFYPGVLVLGGSGGGLREGQAALLASHGYAALALAYFAYDDLPPRLERIPLEYFERALGWMRARPDVRGGKLTMMGASRGGELALLLGASFPTTVGAVIAYAPSGVVWGAVGHDAPSWTYHGEPLPYMPNHVSDEQAAAFFAREPFVAEPWYRANLGDAAAQAACAIPVERIRGPVLLLSGEDDAMWPAMAMAELVIERLRAHAFPYRYRHLAYPDTGHLIWPLCCPGLPTTIRHRVNPGLGSSFAYGGTALGCARAAADSWREVLAFLRDI